MASAPERLGSKLRVMERAVLHHAVESCGGNKAAAARLIGVDRKVLDRRWDRHSGDEPVSSRREDDGVPSSGRKKSGGAEQPSGGTGRQDQQGWGHRWGGAATGMRPRRSTGGGLNAEGVSTRRGPAVPLSAMAPPGCSRTASREIAGGSLGPRFACT